MHYSCAIAPRRRQSPTMDPLPPPDLPVATDVVDHITRGLAEIDQICRRDPRRARMAASFAAVDALATRSLTALDPSAPDPHAARHAHSAIARAAQSDRLTAGCIIDLHDTTASRDGAPSGARTEPGYLRWVRPDGTSSIVFEGAPHDQLHDHLAALTAWASDPRGLPVVQALGSFLRLVELHPFLDGNGRTGRLLVHVVLRRRLGLAHTAAPLAPVMAADQEALAEATAAWRDGDATRALTAVTTMLDTSVRRAAHLLGEPRSLVRPDGASRRAGIDTRASGRLGGDLISRRG